MTSTPSPWPFADKPNVAVFTTKSVAKGKDPILFVSHDEDDGSWQFLGEDEWTEDNSSVQEIASQTATTLARLVGRARGAADAVVEAHVVVRFSVAWPAGGPRQHPNGDPVACEVHLIDTAGRRASAIRVTFCRPHDPTRESRSARARDNGHAEAVDRIARPPGNRDKPLL